MFSTCLQWLRADAIYLHSQVEVGDINRLLPEVMAGCFIYLHSQVEVRDIN